MKAIRTWIVVADGAGARLFLNTGPGKGLQELPDGRMQTALEATRSQGSDRPGRVHDRMGDGRHAMEPRIDWHEQQKQRFARELSQRLDAAAGGKAFDRLILVAPPKLLGALRSLLGAGARRLVTGELPKDLMRASEKELLSQLGAIAAL